MLGEKIFDYRKKNGMSQETLAEKLNVARQTVSNWETGETAPNPDQLKILSKVFNVSIDELLENDDFIRSEKSDNFKKEFFDEENSSRLVGFEYKSKKTFHGIPLVHINIGGIIPRRAKGIIAIGDIAQGVVALGGISAGVVSLGGVSAGLISMGGLAVGLIVALGGAAIAPIACGAAAVGVIAYGAGSVGVIAGGVKSFSFYN